MRWKVKSYLMYIIAVAWLYVALLAAAADTSVIGGVLTFVFWGVAPLALFLWLVGTPARHRHAAARPPEDGASGKDRADSAGNQ